MYELTAWLRATIEGDKATAEDADGEEWVLDTEGQDLFLAPAGAEARPYHAERIAEWTYVINPRRPGEWEECDRTRPFHIVRHDPRDTIARCEAELDILAEHEHLPAEYPGFGCRMCAVQGDEVGGDGWCRTVRLLAYGYRHRPGYKEDWRP